MTQTFNHTFVPSFLMFFDHQLTNSVQAFTNFTTGMYPSADQIFPGYTVYKSPHDQFIYDTSVSGANVLSGVYINGSFVQQYESGIHINYNQGNVLVPNSIPAPYVSGNYAFKDFNIYYTSESEETILFQTKYVLNTKVGEPALTGLQSNEKSYPVVFIKFGAGDNTPFCFGGIDVTHPTARAIIIADTQYNFDGIVSVFRDTERLTFCLFGANQLPFDGYGDIKTGLAPFNYQNNVNTISLDPNRQVYIEKVRVSTFGETLQSNISRNIVAGFVDFEFWIARNPRAPQ